MQLMATLEESFSQLTVENRLLGELKAKGRQAATAYEEAVDRRIEHQTDWRNLDDLVKNIEGPGSTACSTSNGAKFGRNKR